MQHAQRDTQLGGVVHHPFGEVRAVAAVGVAAGVPQHQLVERARLIGGAESDVGDAFCLEPVPIALDFRNPPESGLVVMQRAVRPTNIKFSATHFKNFG